MRLKNDSWLPLSCSASNSGGSRYRSVRMPVTDRKSPTVWDPPPMLRSPEGLLNEPNPNEALPVGFGWSRPDLVTMCTTRLLLSPYSAGGTPVITSIDCTASCEIWLEYRRLCWSVIGWLSIENWVWAWSPTG